MSQYNNLEDWFRNQRTREDKIQVSPITISNEEVELQFNGFSLTLLTDGTYILDDTSG